MKLYPAQDNTGIKDVTTDGHPAGTFTNPSFVMRQDFTGRGVQQGGEYGSPASAKAAAERQKRTEIANRESAGAGFPFGRPTYYVASRGDDGKFDIEYVR